ncbi:phage portal protein [Maricaulis sp.]|uniref:phage portal protein n=1 Tax=Maricaulis sp. TaxID=1486257 RepID=UPI00260C31FC|nr:phage portal protein [Maricaulis sp.]
MPNWFARLTGAEGKSVPARALSGISLAGSHASLARDIPSLTRAGYERNAIAHRCVRLIAEAAASIPLTSEDRAVQALLDSPNPDQAGAELWESFYGYLQVAGNAYLELVSLEEEPRGLFALRPDRVRVLPGDKGWPAGWEYATGSRRRRFVRDALSGRSAVFHMRLFHPGDDYYGLSPLSAAAEAIHFHNGGSEWARALLNNAARPSGALVVSGEDGRLSETQFERLKAQLLDAHSGARNAGRPLLLEGGLDWKPMALSPADMDFIDARRESAREIALALGVPPLLLGLPGDNTYANYKEAQLAFWRQTVLPLVRKCAGAMTVWLRPWMGETVSVQADISAAPLQAEDGK